MKDAFSPSIRVATILLALFVALGTGRAHAAQFDLIGPPGSVSFGAQVAVLPNGNLVVTDPRRPPNGAAYLYSREMSLISTVTNIFPNTSSTVALDSVQIVVLKNGNYVLTNWNWPNESVRSAGMVAWGSAETGLQGVISSANALVGTSTDDRVGDRGVQLLANGNYVVSSWMWNDGGEPVGAVTWGSGSNGVSGAVSAQNSVVGSSLATGTRSAVPLTNGNYVILGLGTPLHPAMGAAMWVDGTVGATGNMTEANSLFGSTDLDFLLQTVFPLSNGNYVIAMPYWDNGDQENAGAVIWGDGTRPIVGAISSANALVGARTENWVGYDGVQPLSNGNYVVASSYWEGENGVNVGAVTWGNGATGNSGEVSAQNSLIGGADFQFIGGFPGNRFDSVVALTNGHYVVTSPQYDNQKGAITWGNGTQGTVGIVSPQNSLVGATPGDLLGASLGSGVTALANGNYVVPSAGWKNANSISVGAATWVDGDGPRTGTVEPGNSLVGNTPANSGISVVALTNGHYVVAFSGWNRGATSQAGAVIWGNGDSGTIGTPSPQTALVGAREQSFVGGPVALSDGNYIVCSELFGTSSADNVGAVTWASGWGGRVGEIDASNSLIGTSREDRLCSGEYDYRNLRMPTGQYLIVSHQFDDGTLPDAGAITWAQMPLAGHVSHENSVIGTVAEGGEGGGRPGLFADYDFANRRVLVGRPASNLVTVMTPSIELDAADLSGRVSADPSHVSIFVDNLSTTTSSEPATLRARFDFTRRSGTVSAPSNCVALQSSVGRMFDCTVISMAPGSSAELEFGISGASARGLNVSANISPQSFESNTSNNCFAASIGTSVGARSMTTTSPHCRVDPIRAVTPPRIHVTELRARARTAAKISRPSESTQAPSRPTTPHPPSG